MRPVQPRKRRGKRDAKRIGLDIGVSRCSLSPWLARSTQSPRGCCSPRRGSLRLNSSHQSFMPAGGVHIFPFQPFCLWLCFASSQAFVCSILVFLPRFRAIICSCYPAIFSPLISSLVFVPEVHMLATQSQWFRSPTSAPRAHRKRCRSPRLRPPSSRKSTGRGSLTCASCT